VTADRPPAAGLDRRDLLRLAGLIAVLLAIVGVVLLAGGGGSSEGGRGQMRGVLTDVSDTRIVLRTDRGDTQDFTVRPQDRRNLDLFHLQQHAADALPSIVHYERDGNTRYATRVDDAPTG
jgi:hypothetical protein